MKIHQVKGRHVNSYVVEGQDGLLVIDVAWGGEKYVLGFIKDELKRDPKEVKLVACTHGDPDHSGGLVDFANACDAKVAVPYAMHSIPLQMLNDPTGFVFRFITVLVETFRPRMWAMYANPNRSMKARELPAYSPDEFIDEAVEIKSEPHCRLKHRSHLPDFASWQVIHTPGHSWDSCCFYHKETESLITGDTLLGSQKKGGVVTPAIYSNPIQMRYSLHRLKKLNPKAIYPGHGSYFEGQGLLDHI